MTALVLSGGWNPDDEIMCAATKLKLQDPRELNELFRETTRRWRRS